MSSKYIKILVLNSDALVNINFRNCLGMFSLSFVSNKKALNEFDSDLEYDIILLKIDNSDFSLAAITWLDKRRLLMPPSKTIGLVTYFNNDAIKLNTLKINHYVSLPFSYDELVDKVVSLANEITIARFFKNL